MRTLSLNRSVVASVLVLLVFLFLSSWAQQIFDVSAQSPAAAKKNIFLDLQPPLLSPGAEKNISFGFDNALADWNWIDLIQTLHAWRGDNRSVAKKLDIITALDPRFEYPYIIGIFIVPFYDRIDEVRALGLKGIEALPNSWKIPFYLGVQMSYKGNDQEEALRYLNIAKERGGNPGLVSALIAAISAKTGKYEASRALWQKIYETEQDQTLKKAAQGWLERLDVLERIKQEIGLYYKTVGKMPASMNDLLQKGYLKGVPEDMLQYTYAITPDGNLEIIKLGPQ
jgi:tetratricopeptide (TPR) repeat protein